MTMTLPSQTEVDDYLKRFFRQYKTQSFYLSELTVEVIEHFGVSPEDAEAQPEFSHGQTAPTTTNIEQFTHWACVHLLHSDDIKRTSPNTYQHITGPAKEYVLPKVAIDRAMVSVRILKNLHHPPEAIMVECSHLWEDDVLEVAINQVFAI